MAMRAALGASRRRVLQQMLTESLMLSGAGGVLGLLLALCTIGGLIRLCPVRLPRLDETSVDLSVLAFTLGLSVLTGLVFGTVPAWKASSIRLTRMLQEGAARATTGHRGRRLHGALVVVQVGLSLVLLIGAALLIRSLIALNRLDLGFRPQNVLAVTVSVPETRYSDPQRCRAFFESLLERVRALPQVRAAGLSSGELGLGFGGAGAVSVSVPGRLPSAEKENPALFSSVTPGFLETLNVRLLRGRTLTDRDGAGQSDSVVIDERLARRYFGDSDPVGRRLDFPDSRHTVVGVMETVKDYDNLDQTWGAVYAPISGIWWFPEMVLVVRTDGDPVPVTDAIRAQAAALEKDEVVRRVETVEAKLSGMLAPRRFSMILLSVFAGTALVLATVGVYGLLNYSTAQQTRDIGIRMALGAERADVRWMVLKQGLKLVLIGVVVGIAGALALTRVLSNLLYDVAPTDPVTLALMSGVLSVIALLASYFPARRAARIDPMAALRHE
jgi:putative ABC transport system permease protein